MFNINIKSLLGIASLNLLVTALPAADPNDDDFQCLSSWHSWDASSSQNQYTTTVVSSIVHVTDIIDPNVPLSTLCDGRPRGQFTQSSSTETYDPPSTQTIYNPLTTGTPTCTIAETACTPILSSYTSSLSDYLSSSSASPGAPHCSTYVPCSLNPSYCFIYAGLEKTLYY